MKTALFTGACRSGKSALAQQWAERYGTHCLYLATAPIHDEEMAARVRAHRAARGAQWKTLELASESDVLDLPATLARVAACPHEHVVLIDCTTLWLTGLMLQGWEDDAILEKVEALCLVIQQALCPVAIVHNETGWGIVPESPLGRRFRDISGLVGQRLATVCDEVILAVCGLPVIVKKSLQ